MYFGNSVPWTGLLGKMLFETAVRFGNSRRCSLNSLTPLDSAILAPHVTIARTRSDEQHDAKSHAHAYIMFTAEPGSTRVSRRRCGEIWVLHNMMHSAVIRTTPARLSAYARSQPFVCSVAKPVSQRGLTRMGVAEGSLDKTTPDDKWKELLTAEEVRNPPLQ